MVEDSIRRTYRNIELAAREGTLLIDRDGRIVDARKVDEHFGIAADLLIGEPPLPAGWKMFDGDTGDPIPPDAHPALVALRTGECLERVLIYDAAQTGTHRKRLRFIANPVTDDPEVAVDVVVIDQDRRQAARRSLESQESRFRTMTDMLRVAVWEATMSGEVIYVNPKFVDLTGLDADVAPDLPMLDLVHPDDVLTVMEAANRSISDGEYRCQYRLVHVDGTSRWVSSRVSALVGADGKMTGFVGVIEDIDDLRRSERRAQRLAEIVEVAADAVLVFERRALTYVNRSAATLLARLDPAFTTDLPNYSYSGEVLERLPQLESLVAEDGTWSGDVEFTDLDGARVDLALSVYTESDDGEIRHIVMAHDIRERKIREAELAHSAFHDPLTGLANRHRLTDVIAQTEPTVSVGVLFVDLDHFKEVNDAHGHAAGDRVLEITAQRVLSAVDDGDLVARVGGDEMVVWAPARAELGSLAERIVRSISAQPVHLDDVVCSISVTVGGALT